MILHYRAVLFDIDHTLCSDGSVERHVLSAMLVAAGLPDDASLEAVVGGILTRMRAGPMPVKDAMAALFREVLMHATVEDAAAMAESFCRRSLEELPQRMKVLAGATEILEAVRASGTALALMSNGWPGLQREKARIIGFDGEVFISEDMHRWKPDPEAFLVPLRHLGVAPAEALYVGDNPRTDILGAHSAGMDAAWINEDGAPFPDTPPPTYQARSLDELRQQLGF